MPRFALRTLVSCALLCALLPARAQDKLDMLPGEYPVAQVEGWILGVM